MVEWRSVPGFPDYEVSDFGRVRRAVANARYPKGYVLQPSLNTSGYPYVMLTRDGKAANFRIHRLVCEAFHGPAPSTKHEVAHNDGTRTNCGAANLRWATRKENQDDRALHGTSNRGERQGRVKLTEAQVREIKLRLKAGDTPTPLARRYGVNESTVRLIKTGRNWSHVAA